MRHVCFNTVVWFIALAGVWVSGFSQVTDTDTLWLNPVVIHSQTVSEVYSVDSIPVLELKDATTLVDALRSSGSHYIREYGVGNIANVTMRGGSSQHTALYWNGLPINSPSLGISDLSLIPTIFLDEVQLYPGASSLLTGTGGLSGSMMLRSGVRRGDNQVEIKQSISPALAEFTTGVAINVRNSSWSSRTGLHDHQAVNAFDYLDDSGANSEWKERENAATRSRGISQDLSCDLDDRYSVSLSTYFIAADREIPANIGLPVSEDTQEDRIGRASLWLDRKGSRWVYSLMVGDSEEWQRYRSPQASIESNVRTSSTHLALVSSHALREKTFVRGRYAYDRFSLDLDEEDRRSTDRQSLFAELDHTTGRDLRVNAGIRFEQVDDLFSPLTLSLGFSQLISSLYGLSVKASWSMNHRDPTLNDRYWPELGNPDLASESGVSSDIGLQLERNDVFMSMNLFYNEMEGLISWLPSSDGRFHPVNVSESQNKGVESQIRLQLLSWLALRGSLSYTDSQVRRREGEEYQQSIYQPLYRAYGGLTGTQGPHAIEVDYSYNSEVRIDYLSSSDELPDVHLLDVSYRFSPSKFSGVSMGFELHNLLDRNIQYVAQRPTAGRYFQFKLIVNINERS